MLEKQARREVSYEVRCVWCGITIRPDDSGDSDGMCLECFQRLLNEYFRVRQQANNLPSASER